MQDINSRSEIELMVNRFYDKVKQDELLAALGEWLSAEAVEIRYQ